MSEYLMYLRKSRQDDPNETVEEVLRKHEIQLQEYALTNFGYRIPEKDVYREVVSGETIQQREQIRKVFERLESENIKGVIVKDISRLSRGDLYDCGIVLHSFLYTNTLVITPTKTYNLNEKFDKKYFEMELTRGADYLEYAKEVLASGRLASKRRGNYIHTTPPYGYDRIKIGKDWTLKTNEDEARYVKMAFELYADGNGCYIIANTLEKYGAKPRNSEHFTEGTIRQMLRNEVYLGKIRVGERTTLKVMEDGKVTKKRIRHKEYEIVEGKHEAIISQDLFDKVQARRGSVTREKGCNELKNMYAGLMKCGKCGQAIERADFLKNGIAYRSPRFRCKNIRNCDNISHNVEPIHQAIVNELKMQLDDFKVKVEQNNQGAVENHENLILALKKQLDDVVSTQEKICDYLESGVYSVDMFVTRNNKLKEEKERLETAIKKAETEVPAIRNMNEMLVTFHETLDMLDDESISAKTKNTFLKKIVDVIYYTKDEHGISLDVHLKL